MNIYKKILILTFFLITLGSFYSYSKISKASVFDNISGHAWSSNIGWISFNCTDELQPCQNSNYGVTKDNNDYLTGFAWSSNLGWLKFGGLSGFPTGGGALSENAKVQNDGSVTGWARFCSPAANPITCNGATITNYSNGGWDGWVSLQGTSPDYGITFDSLTGDFSGFAWGGDVVGWVSFNCSNELDPCKNSNYKVKYTSPGAPTVLLTADPNPINDGEYTVLSWTGVNLSTTDCDADVSPVPATGNTWKGTKQKSPSGTFNTGALPKSNTDYVFKITCYDSANNPVESTVAVHVGIEIDFYAVPSAGYAPNYTTTLNWKTVPSGVDLTGCLATTTYVGTGWGGAIGDLPKNTTKSQIVTVTNNPTVYNIECFHNSSSVTASVSVPRVIPTETVRLSNTAVQNNLTNITWETKNVVDGSCHPTPPSGTNWDATDPKLPTIKSTENNVSVPSGPNTTYTLTCEGAYSGRSISAKLILNEFSGATKSKIKIKEQ